jgi:hypothetical protein
MMGPPCPRACLRPPPPGWAGAGAGARSAMARRSARARSPRNRARPTGALPPRPPPPCPRCVGGLRRRRKTTGHSRASPGWGARGAACGVRLWPQHFPAHPRRKSRLRQSPPPRGSRSLHPCPTAWRPRHSGHSRAGWGAGRTRTGRRRVGDSSRAFPPTRGGGTAEAPRTARIAGSISAGQRLAVARRFWRAQVGWRKGWAAWRHVGTPAGRMPRATSHACEGRWSACPCLVLRVRPPPPR